MLRWELQHLCARCQASRITRFAFISAVDFSDNAVLRPLGTATRLVKALARLVVTNFAIHTNSSKSTDWYRFILDWDLRRRPRYFAAFLNSYRQESRGPASKNARASSTNMMNAEPNYWWYSIKVE
jgi:hypothetical protein